MTIGEFFPRLLILIVIGLFAYAIYDSFKKNPNHKKQQQEKALRLSITGKSRKNKEEFYAACLKAGIGDLSKPADRERLNLFARNNGIKADPEALAAAYEEGRTYYQQTLDVKRSQMIQEKTSKETEAARQEDFVIQTRNQRFSNCFGQEKTVQICRSNISRYVKEIQAWEDRKREINRGARNLSQKEVDWAVAGGVASGIAGNAAGLATALEAQKQNNNAKQYNSMVAMTAGNALMQANAAQKEAERNKALWESKLEKAKMLLVDTQDKNKLFSYLNVTVGSKTRSISGSGRVTLTVCQKTPVIIFDTVQAVVDGSVRVLAKMGNDTVGVGILTFPLNGPGSGVTDEVVCECVKGKSIPATFSVEVVPDNLWAIEKLS